ncbi:hypothetical protein [Mucilaginibacter sp.]|uniref:hypothetical protein n=1 Tax=Mucilaginibacter sp. TaxID=1882438 RepID=UPI0025D2B235|nr:hypothetical protein [Mucilaginibacter sp.]
MKKILIFLTLVPGFVFAQQNNQNDVWRLRLVDSLTLKAIENVTVTVNDLAAFMTDVNGMVSLRKQNVGLNGSLKFSCIGYNTSQFKMRAGYNMPDTIKMLRSIISLKEVKINSAKATKIALGETADEYKGRYYPLVNEELALYIPNKKKLSAIIASVYFFVNDGLKGIDKPFKVQLYTKNDDSLYPDKEMIKDSIIVYNPKKLHKLEVDLTKYNLQVPVNGFFIVFETLSAKWYGDDLVQYGQQYCHRVPGIDRDYENINDWMVQNDPRIGADREYSLTRRDRDHENPWTTFALGENFAMGAILIEN